MSSFVRNFSRLYFPFKSCIYIHLLYCNFHNSFKIKYKLSQKLTKVNAQHVYHCGYTSITFIHNIHTWLSLPSNRERGRKLTE